VLLTFERPFLFLPSFQHGMLCDSFEFGVGEKYVKIDLKVCTGYIQSFIFG
jgi:hypothetical protein